MPDQNRTRRILAIIITIIVLALLGYAVYRFFIASGTGSGATQSPQPPVSGGATGGPVTSPALSGTPGPTPLPSPTVGLETEIKEQTLLALSDFSVSSPAINKNQNQVFFYQKNGGDLFLSDFEGAKQKISNITIVGLTEALWSPAKDRSIISYIDNETLKSFLHIGTSSVVSLPQNIKGLSWSPDGKQFAYLLQNQNNDNLSLIISDAAGKNTSEIYKTLILDAQISWISGDKIAFLTAPSGQAEGFLFLFSRSSHSFKKILGPVSGLTTLWSPDGSRMLVSAPGPRGGLTTAIYDSSGIKEQQLNFSTLTEKCVWSTPKELYCAVPQGFPQGALLPDDYLRGEFATQDRIVSFSTDTGDTNTVLEGGAMDMANLAVTTKKDYLIFVNRTDGILWRLKLQKASL